MVERFKIKTVIVGFQFPYTMTDLLEKDEFLKMYRSVSGQLKRKFVRKPNLSEVVEAYGKKLTKTIFFKIIILLPTFP